MCLNHLEEVQPIYEEFSGWKSGIKDYTAFDALPKNTKAYIQYLETEMNVPISIISIGPKRHQIIHRN